MAKLEKVLADNRRFREKKGCSGIHIDLKFKGVVEELEKMKPMTEWSFWEVTDYLSSNFESGENDLITQFVECALNVQYMDDDLVLSSFFHLFINIDKYPSIPKRMADAYKSNKTQVLLKLNKIFKNLVIKLEKINKSRPNLNLRG